MKSSKNAQIHRLKKLYELSMELSGDPMDIFIKVARMIGELMDVKVVCLSEIRGRELYFLSVYVQGKIHTNAGCCPLKITPCATVEQSKDIQVYQHVMERFPKADFLQEHNAFSYCGFPSLGHDGTVLAVTCLLDDRPRDFSDEDKELLRIFGQRVGLEIERKHMDDRQKENTVHLGWERNRLRRFMDGLFVFAALIDSNGKIIEANSTPWKLAGIQREDYIGTQFEDSRAWAYDSKVQDKVKLAILRAQKGETVRYDAPLMIRKNIVIVDFSLTPIFDESAQVTEIVACGVDITDRKRMETALRSSEERLELAMLGADLQLWDWDVRTGTVIFSEQWAKVLGYELEEIKPSFETWEILVHPYDLTKVKRAVYDNLMAKTTFFEIEYRLLTKDNGWRWTLGRGKVVTRDADGKAIRVSGVDMVISERKRLEELLRQKQDELYSAQRFTAAGELAAIVAHELNQPLGAINNYVGGALLRYSQQLSQNPDLAEVLERVLKLSQRAITVIQGIRSLVRKQKGDPELVSIEDVTDEVLAMLQSELINKQIKFSIDYPPALPPIWFQRIHLQQLLLNLILNAIQAMDTPSCKQRKLMVGAKPVGNHKLEITIGDTGPGIAPEITARLFEPFVSTKAEGIGLGLSICRTITEAYGGRISIRPMDGPGTMFVLNLPIDHQGGTHGG